MTEIERRLDEYIYGKEGLCVLKGGEYVAIKADPLGPAGWIGYDDTANRFVSRLSMTMDETLRDWVEYRAPEEATGFTANNFRSFSNNSGWCRVYYGCDVQYFRAVDAEEAKS